ncbi:MAG TPA: hypothetical protein PKK83_16225 [Polyangiaceae bacterium]|jgi:hypothetical protein|nr:hypothetical protein [Polyangiaceae bacterium]
MNKKLVCLVVPLSMWFLGCTNDYDEFSFQPGSTDGGADSSKGGSGGATGGSGGATGGSGGATGGSGGATGGSGGATGGSGGATGGSGGETGGSGGATGGSGGATGGSGGAAGCGGTQKLCGSTCVDLDDPQTGCADPNSCDPCVIPNATAACELGQCAIGTCNTGFEDCDHDTATGCDAELAVSTDHCGACARACSDAHVVTPVCEKGLCMSTCETGYGNCEQPATGDDDGCETNLKDSTDHCGGCNNACPSNAAQHFVCRDSRCACDSNEDCSIGGATGTCYLSNPSDYRYGRCRCGNNDCRPGEVCHTVNSQSRCSCNGGQGCSTSQTCCQTPAGCFYLNWDRNNCGACGHVCPTGQNCIDGSCH